MSGRNWLDRQLDQARQEVQSWDEWKRDAMRREATSISVGRGVAPRVKEGISLPRESDSDKKQSR
jgi:hypothetical protein